MIRWYMMVVGNLKKSISEAYGFNREQGQKAETNLSFKKKCLSLITASVSFLLPLCSLYLYLYLSLSFSLLFSLSNKENWCIGATENINKPFLFCSVNFLSLGHYVQTHFLFALGHSIHVGLLGHVLPGLCVFQIVGQVYVKVYFLVF